jgi:hypothetical protein
LKDIGESEHLGRLEEGSDLEIVAWKKDRFQSQSVLYEEQERQLPRPYGSSVLAVASVSAFSRKELDYNLLKLAAALVKDQYSSLGMGTAVTLLMIKKQKVVWGNKRSLYGRSIV